MDFSRELFADGIGEISLSNGMVRIDLITYLTSQKTKDQPPEVAVRQRVVMPPDGFLRSFGAMENLVKQLIDAGLVKPRNQENSENPVSVGTETSTDQPKSPNF